MTIDYASAFDNCALYLPAVNQQYASYALNGSFSRSLPLSAQDLNFLSSGSSLFYYPWALYSAGVAAPTSRGSEKPDMISERNRSRTVVLCDSGGFQVMNDPKFFKGEETTLRILRWMEGIADYSMVLDFPAGGIGRGTMHAHAIRLAKEGFGNANAASGIDPTVIPDVGLWPIATLLDASDLDDMCASNGQSREFNACLMQTMINNETFVRHHTPGATKFLNALHGRNEAESRTWYKAVRDFPFSGWAFGSGHIKNFSLLLSRIIDLRDDGILSEVEWLHIFGTAKLESACLYTTLLQCIREHVNPTLRLSFDSAAPFVSAGKFEAVAGCKLTPQGWSVFTVHAAGFDQIGNHQTLYEYLTRTAEYCRASMDGQGFGIPLPTAISQVVRMSDLCVTRENSAAWEGESVHLAANHNVQAYVRAMRAAYDVYMGADQRPVPTDIQAIREMIKLVFEQGNPRELIEEYRPWLDGYAVTLEEE